MIITSSDRSALIRLAATMPKGSPERRAILTGLVRSKTAATAEMRLLGRDAEINEAFLTALRRARPGMISVSPRNLVYVHPEVDNDPDFRGGSEYDFYFFPKADEEGWFRVTAPPGKMQLLEDDAKEIRAKVTR